MALILASKSPRRQELLGRLHIPFEVVVLPTRELSPGEAAAEELPVLNAELKARAVARSRPDDLVLGADTVIVFDGTVIGKPRDRRDALATLAKLSGRTHKVVTGIALLRERDHLREVWSEETSVTFRDFGPEVAEKYLSLVDVMDKAGSYALQEHGEMLIGSVDGDPDNVIGLPLQRLSCFFSREKKQDHKAG